MCGPQACEEYNGDCGDCLRVKSNAFVKKKSLQSHCNILVQFIVNENCKKKRQGLNRAKVASSHSQTGLAAYIRSSSIHVLIYIYLGPQRSAILM